MLTLAVMVALHCLWPVYSYWTFPVSLLGLVPLAIGIGLNLAADSLFKRHGTTVKPFEEPSSLVTAFPFSISRNPMYLGMVIILIGVALLLGTVSPLIPAIVLPVVIDRRFVRMEERMLAARFGEQWEQYRLQVRRWI
jgi:protein-S-isoprenylcysteine O-methyltransferase Ste14